MCLHLKFSTLFSCVMTNILLEIYLWGEIELSGVIFTLMGYKFNDYYIIYTSRYLLYVDQLYSKS